MPDDLAGGVLEGIKDISGSVASAVGEELKKVGKTVAGQMTGKQPGFQAPSAQEVSKLSDKDKEFSKQGEAEVRARINAYYQEYASKKKKLEMQQIQTQKAKEEEKKEIVQIKKKEAVDVAVAQARSNAETKNYGAE